MRSTAGKLTPCFRRPQSLKTLAVLRLVSKASHDLHEHFVAFLDRHEHFAWIDCCFARLIDALELQFKLFHSLVFRDLPISAGVAWRPLVQILKCPQHALDDFRLWRRRVAKRKGVTTKTMIDLR